MNRNVRGLLAAPLLVAVACSGESGNGPRNDAAAGPVEPPPLQGVRGTVYNATTGGPIADATVFTSPPTESVTTDVDGAYRIEDVVNGEGLYRINASKLGFAADQRTVTVGAGSVSTADFFLAPNTDGLVVSVPSIHLPANRSSVSFVLTSTAADTGFTASAADPWLRAVPTSGLLGENENKLIRIEVDRNGLSGARATTQLVINASNGLPGVVLDVTVDLQPDGGSQAAGSPPPPEEAGPTELGPTPPSEEEPAPDVPPTLGDGQADCRRSDILSFSDAGRDEPVVPQVFFPPSTGLPGGEGHYDVTPIPSSGYFDSFDVRQAGTLTVAHVSGGPARTYGVLFDLDRNNNIRDVAYDADDNTGLSRVSASMPAGLYCYGLAPHEGVFLGAPG